MKTLFTILLALGTITCQAATEADIVAATLILEAGGEYAPGSMEAVHEVIRNRSVKRSLTVAQVCLQRLQFSCWNSGQIEAKIAKAKRHPRWSEAVRIVNGPMTNFTHGADHYHADYVTPYWAETMTVTVKIGRHIFYK